jgi:polyhydroxyalkanoate synthesis repressor PhaR
MLYCLPPLAAQTPRVAMAKSAQPVAIKQYANRRLYNPGEGRYLALTEIAAMVEAEEEFVVYDAQTGEDITRSVLKKIIIERANHG